MRQIAENFGTARAMLLALGVTMGLAGCQPTAQGSEAAPKDPPAKTLAHVLQSRPPADDAQGCFTQLKGPAKVETVTGQVQVIPEQRDPKTGKVTQPAIYRELRGQKLVDSGKPRCVACGLCEFACPTDCISIVPGELEGSRIERYPEAFDIDLSRCMFCGLCEEACPEEAIVMSREVELSTYDRPSLIFKKEQLLVPENLLKRRLDFLRAEYDRDATSGEGDG